ncbi:MBL fold metallo-hydrolase (plasmid) [Haladaptatus sp. SPP-AMP-3]|uniref:MBL fold metallo-hydrolase n=1 Tax=Haladaptatus sp. SPP-AMP-3 TaxID=3121295 RepID=UPI003C30D85F
MDLTLLGSGGNFPMPMPTCDCQVCCEAREKGVPYSRAGNATFVHDVNALVDAPESIWRMLNREAISDVKYIFVSHHHSDHVRGLRVVQALGRGGFPVADWENADPPTIVLSENTYELFGQAHGILAEYENWGFAEFETLNDGETLALGDVEVTCFGWEIEPGEGTLIFGFLFDDGASKTLVTPDETKFLDTARLPDDIDLWIRECGLFRTDPRGNPILTDDLWEEETNLEITFEETVEQVQEVGAERTVLAEIEELFQRSHDDLRELEAEYEDLNLRFGYDGMGLSV